MLDAAWKLRMLALERFSQPLLLGRYPAHRGDWQAALEQALQEARRAGYITLPEGVEILPLTLAGRNAEDFAQAVRDLRHEIYLSITGALLHGLEGNRTGARCLGEVHRSTAELLIWHLAQLVADALNSQLIPDLVHLNFAQADVPRVQLVGVNDRELQASLQVDRGLLAMGLPLSRAALHLRYGRQAPWEPDDQLMGMDSRQPEPSGTLDMERARTSLDGSDGHAPLIHRSRPPLGR
jgi:phage gp29-like protein